MNEILDRYEKLYADMASSNDSKRMRGFGEAEKWAFSKIVESNPKLAQCWLDRLEAMHWNNYLSKTEADEIVTKLVNQDGTKGAHWAFDSYKAAVEIFGGKMCDEPYYNEYALWATSNMEYSDHYRSASEYVPKDDMAKYFYKVAVEKLKDADRPEFVREYFHL